MRELTFVKMDPSGNSTLLVTDPVPRSAHLELGRLLMSEHFLSVEQVGYVEAARNTDAAARLQMMGGEFCGNASRALAALLVERGVGVAGVTDLKLPSGADKRYSVRLEVSGSDDYVDVRVAPRPDGSWWTEAIVPVPLSVWEENCVLEGASVSVQRVIMPGIEHLVVEGASPSKAAFEELCARGTFSETTEARGVMFLDAVGDAAAYADTAADTDAGTCRRITPLVAVGNEAPVREGSCGSGSVAVAACIAHRTGTSVTDLRLLQPEGELTVDLVWSDGAPRRATIKGIVRKIASGTVWVPRRLM